MPGRKSLLKSTQKGPSKTPPVETGTESKRKKAILDAVKRSSASVKATLEELGLPQSTYYTWLKQYKAKGLNGLDTGSPVSGKVWKRYVSIEKREDEQLAESKLSPEETQTMTSASDDKTRKLLFKRFDKEASKKPEKAEAPATKVAKEPPSPPSYSPPPEAPKDKTFMYAIGAFAFVIAILLLASLSNSNQFYFKKNDQMVELWQGRFAPMGSYRVASFSDPRIVAGVQLQQPLNRKKAYGLLSDYFINRADEILKTGEMPDLKAARSYLSHASKYAVSDQRRQEVKTRLDRMNFLVLLGKGELARSRGTIPDFETAKGYLTEAIPYASTDLEKDMITKSLAATEYAIAKNKIGKGEKQLADLYQEAMNQHLKKAKEYDPGKAMAIDQEIEKIKKWLTEFEGREGEAVGH
ncbi:MAG: helix-turn-helix domain-containing protein [Deltaproteobacteria bacterium]|jgi:transposase-like protein